MKGVQNGPLGNYLSNESAGNIGLGHLHMVNKFR